MKLIKIGRDPSCDIVMHSPKVSSLHAELTLLNNGDILLEDKGSRNGTFIMNQPIKPNKPVNVRVGDAIRFADVELQWSQVPKPEDNSAYKGLYGIGSHFNNDIQISGNTVSRYHATVKQGRDNKMYIVDHSKNGTTVDGNKLQPNVPMRIKRNSAVVCGGVPVDLSRLPWPNNPWKKIAAVAASIVVLVGVGFGVWKMWPDSNRKWNSGEIYSRYHSSVVQIVGTYHYEVEAGSFDLHSIGMAKEFLDINGELRSIDNMDESVKYAYGSYTATAFFVSKSGHMITNLHVVKPWLFNEKIKQVEEAYRIEFARRVEALETKGAVESALLSILSGEEGGTSTHGLSAFTAQIKIKGKLDRLMFVPQGRYFKTENATYCTVVEAGDDIAVDVALIQSDKMELPNSSCTYVNVADSLDVSKDALKVGTEMFTIGFPHGNAIQEDEIPRALCHSGHITKESGKYNFTFDAVSAEGASGSPIFNDQGMLIGVLSAGVEKENINRGVRGIYVKQLLDEAKK